MELKGQGREREHKIKGTLASGNIILSHQLEDLVPQNKDQEHRGKARSWQQKKKLLLHPQFLHTQILESRSQFTGTQGKYFWK